MSPYWSQERLFGRWGPTNRTLVRIMAVVVTFAVCVLAWGALQFFDYSHRLNTYVHNARADREKNQKKQQAEIVQLQKLQSGLQVAQRDLACYTATYFRRILAPKKDPFIESLYSRYDCVHYKVPPKLPRFPVTRSTSPPASSHPPSGSSSSPRPPGASPTPSSSPRPRSSPTVVARPGPTVTRTTTRTASPTSTPTRTVTAPAPTPTHIVCILTICIG